MPRDSNGLYTLPTGNPVTDGTIIEASWANNTISDLAQQLNNVITRDGLLGPTEPFMLPNGSALTPALAWATQPNLGFYRDVINTIGIVAHGVVLAKFSDTSFDSYLYTGISDGSESLPAIRFINEVGTGLYRDSAGVFGLSVGGVGIVDFTAAGVLYYRAAAFPKIGVERGTVAAPSLAFTVEPTTGFYSSVAGEVDVSILGVKHSSWTPGGYVTDNIEVTNVATIRGALNVPLPGSANISNIIIDTNAAIANLFIGGTIASGLFQRNAANSVSLRAGDSNQGVFGSYTWNQTEFYTDRNIRAANRVLADGGDANIVYDPNLAALLTKGGYGGGLTCTAGAQGFISLYLLAGGAGRLRCYGTGDWIYQFNSDGSFYSKLTYNYFDANHLTYHGWDGSNVTGAYMKYNTFVSHFYLNSIGQMVFATQAGTAMTVDSSGVAIAGTFYVKGRLVPHMESGSVVTDGAGYANVAFISGFVNPSVTCNGEHGSVKVLCTITSRTAAGFQVRANSDSGGDVSCRVNWIAMEATQ